MNTGIQDAHNLAWKLALVAQGTAPESLLDSYDAERLPVAKGILRGTDLLTRVVTLRNPVGTAMRNALISFLAEFDFVQRRIARGMSELNIDYRQSPLVAEDWGGSRGGLRPGDRVPDLPLGGAPGRLFEVLQNGRHTLLLFPSADPEADRTASAIGDLIQRDYRSWVVPCLVRHAEGPATTRWEGPRLDDQGGRLHARFGADTHCLYLVRPDGYVGYRNRPADAGKLASYLRRLFVLPH
jgi:hypothetical protein